MLKFLRHYNKLILMVGGSILMVLFLLPSVPRMGGPSMSQKVGYVGDEPVTAIRLREAITDLEVASRFAPVIVQGIRLDERHKAEHWFLLTHEAEKAGLVGGPEDAEGFLVDSAAMAVDMQIMQLFRQQPQFAQQMLNSRASVIENTIKDFRAGRDALVRAGSTEQAIQTALARARGVYRLVESTNASSLFSTREAVAYGHRISDSAMVDVVVIPGVHIAQSMADPDDAALNAHFEKYRSVDRALDPLGIGYLRPNAVKVEWLTVSRGPVQDQLLIDPIEVNKHWRMNRDRYPGEFAAIKSSVEADYRNAQVTRVMDKAADLVRQELHRSTAALPTDGTYRSLPPDWESKMPALAPIASKVGQELGREFKLTTSPVTANASDGQWKSVDLLQALPGIGGSSQALTNGATISFPLAAINVRELDGDARFGTQKGLLYGPFSDGFGNLHFFRVLDTRKQSPPENIDEVKQQAKADLKLINAMARLESEADVFRERALQDGLATVAGTYASAVDTTIEVTPEVVRYSGSSAPDRRLDAPAFRDKVMAAAHALDPTKEAATQDPALRTIAVALPSARGLAIAQVKSWRPMTLDLFRTRGAEIRNLANSDLGGRAALAAYSFDRLKDRLNYRSTVEEKAETKQSGQAEAATPSGKS